MVSIQTYIEQKYPSIQKFSQTSFSWNTYRNNPFLREHEAFRAMEDQGDIPDMIHRDWVLEQFKDPSRYYLGFVTAMMWGGINSKRPVSNRPGDLRTTNFYKALEVPQHTMTQNLIKTRNLIEQAQLATAHEGYLNGALRIPGIGESYFTKLLFFVGYHTANHVKPLIYDKWTKIMHVWILMSAHQFDTLFRFYSKSSLYRDIIEAPGLLSANNTHQAAAYVDYVTRMNQLANQFSLDPSNLEAYLFGSPLKGAHNRRPENNPRAYMLHQIRAGWNML